MADSSRTERVRVWIADGVPLHGYASYLVNENLASLKTEAAAGRRVMLLEVEGEVGFIPGGSADIRLAGRHRYRVLFAPMTVLRITRLNGEVIQENHHFCEPCMANTAAADPASQRDSPIAGKYYVTYRCPCGNARERLV